MPRYDAHYQPGRYNARMSSQAPPSPSPPKPPVLTSAERQALRRQAHPLRPVVLIGESGLSEAILRETDRALTHHGLIKLRMASDDRELRREIGETLALSLGCDRVQSIGKVLVLWRPRPETGTETMTGGRPSRAPARQTISRSLVPVTKKQAGAGKKPELRPRKRDTDKAAAPEPASRTTRAIRKAPGKPVGKPSGKFPGKAQGSAQSAGPRRAAARPAGARSTGASTGATGVAATGSRSSSPTRSARPAPRTRAPRRGP